MHCLNPGRDYRDLMAHLGFEGLLPSLPAAPEADGITESMNQAGLGQEPAPAPAIPEGNAEDFFNEDSERWAPSARANRLGIKRLFSRND